MSLVTRLLSHEHRLIGRAAACLSRVGDDALENGDLQVVSALELLEFFEEFVDGAHQEKEERFVFPALLRLGLAPHRVCELLDDHQREREALQAMRRDLEGAAYGDPFSRDEFVCVAMQYATMQIEHAAEEDRILLPLIDELIDERTDRRIAERFRERDMRLPRPPEDYVRKVEEVASRLGSCAHPTPAPETCTV